MTGMPVNTLSRPDPVLARETFRAVLDALSRPGRVVTLDGVPAVPPVLLPLLALADLETPFCVLEDGEAWTATVATATSAPPVELPEARLVAALRPVTLAELRVLRPGTPLAPERAALVALAVPSLEGGPPLRLSGPGVRPAATLAAAGLPDRWWTARGRFPLGADLLLVTSDGRCVGLPRSTVITTDDGEN